MSPDLLGQRKPFGQARAGRRIGAFADVADAQPPLRTHHFRDRARDCSVGPPGSVRDVENHMAVPPLTGHQNPERKLLADTHGYVRLTFEGTGKRHGSKRRRA